MRAEVAFGRTLQQDVTHDARDEDERELALGEHRLGERLEEELVRIATDERRGDLVHRDPLDTRSADSDRRLDDRAGPALRDRRILQLLGRRRRAAEGRDDRNPAGLEIEEIVLVTIPPRAAAAGFASTQDESSMRASTSSKSWDSSM